MAHTKPLFACPWLEVIASNLWHCTTHTTVVAFEVAVHIHRNAAFTNQCSFSPEEQPAPLGSASSDEVVLRTFLLALEGPNAFMGSSPLGSLNVLRHKYEAETHASGCLNTYRNLTTRRQTIRVGLMA